MNNDEFPKERQNYDECYGAVYLNSPSPNKHVKRLNRIIQMLDDMKYNDCHDMISTLKDLNDIRYQINRLERDILGDDDDKKL